MEPGHGNFLHVDIIQARNIIPGDCRKEGKIWIHTSDPYCKVRIWPRSDRPNATFPPARAITKSKNLPPKGLKPPPGCVNQATDFVEAVTQQSLQLTGALASSVMRTVGLPVEAPKTKRSTDEVHTSMKEATVDPKWQEVISYTDVPPDASGVEIELWDFDRNDDDDYLGSVVVPLPTSRRGDGPSGVSFGWYALQWPANMRPKLQELLRQAGRDPEKCEPPALGEILVRLSWGHEAQPASVRPALRPSLRRRGGTLRVRVFRCRHVYANQPFSVKVHYEHTDMSTPVSQGPNPVYPEEASVFAFKFTEITAELVLTLMQGQRAIGEGRVPVWPLLRRGRVSHTTRMGDKAFRSGPVWITLLPPRKEFSTLFSTVDRPKQELGGILIDLALGLHSGVPQMYCFQPVLPDRLLDRQRAQANFSHVKLALGRLTDALVAPIASPLRAVCFLQTWQRPQLNKALAAGATAVCLVRPLWALAALLWPFALGSLLPFLGYVSSLIHEKDPVIVYSDELVEASRALREEEREREEMAQMQEARHRMEELAAKEAGVEGEAGGGAAAYGSDVFSIWRYYNDKLTWVEGKVRHAADSLERIQSAFSFADPDVSRIAIPAFFAALAALALAHALVLQLFEFLPFHFRHYVWLFAMLCLAPAPHVTYEALERLDGVIRDYAPFPQQWQVTAGSGLDAAREERARRGAGKKATAEEVRRRAQEAVLRRKEEEIKSLEKESNHKTAAVAPAAGPAAVAAVVGNLLARAPTAERAAHIRAALRLAEAPPGGGPLGGGM